TAPAFTQNVLSFAVAYGAALQGLQLTRLKTNLLPPEIQFDRLIRAKKPWAVAAAAALLIGLPALTLGYAIEKRSVAAAEVEAAIKQGNQKVKDAQTAETNFTTKKSEVEKKEESVKM